MLNFLIAVTASKDGFPSSSIMEGNVSFVGSDRSGSSRPVNVEYQIFCSDECPPN
jgi:hypothetical protein